MAVVKLTALETLLEAPGPIGRGSVTVTYWAGAEEFRGVDGDEVTFSPPIVVDIEDGEPVDEIDLEPTRGVCCVRWEIRSFNGPFSLVRFTSIPDDVDEVAFGDLPVVDPTSYEPADVPATVLDTVQSELLDGIRLQRITQDAYDALPEHDPDVLYVITES